MVEPFMSAVEIPAKSPSIREAILSTLRQNRIACLVLNLMVIGLVASYYLSPESRVVWEVIGGWKVRWSFGFSLISTILAAVFLPTLAQRAMGVAASADEAKRLAWSCIFWGYRGMEIDLFYRLQGHLFGQGHDARTLLAKLVVDQFLYSAFWAIPLYLLFVRWIDLGQWRVVRKSLDRRFWTHTYPSVLFTNWLVWIPAVTLVYSLPAPLQFPLFSIILTFYVLLITVLARA